MVTTPMKCKICGKIISPPDEALIIGEAPQVRNQKILHKLYAHVGGMMEWEAAQPHQPHKQALMDATVAGENLKGAMLIGNFEISPDMEAERQSVLARVHEITRTVRMSDKDLRNMMLSQHSEGLPYIPIPIHQLGDFSPDEVVQALRDLRDRYEGLGKYATLPVVTPAAKPTDARSQKQKEPAHAND